MANPEHLAVLKQGVEAWNKWRQANPGIKGLDLRWANLGGVDLRGVDLKGARLRAADLRGADLRGADLRGTDLHEAVLSWTHLSKADLYGADLHAANLSKADLSEADLGWTDLSGASLHEAILYRADLSGANLSKTNLRGADLREVDLREVDLRGAGLGGARLRNTVFPDINLTEVIGLETCRHEGPSLLGFRTLQQSGSLPLTFLRGCGLSDPLIEYLQSPALLNQPFQYYSCFISYSSKDEDFAQRLYTDLQNKGVRCWFAPHDMKSGQKIHEQICEQIRVYDKLLLVLSEHSMESEWVKTEIAEARQLEVREKRQVLFPISLVAYKTIEQWECFNAHEIREYFIPDFSNWKSHDAYQQSFDRLLRDLKPELERKPEIS